MENKDKINSIPSINIIISNVNINHNIKFKKTKHWNRHKDAFEHEYNIIAGTHFYPKSLLR